MDRGPQQEGGRYGLQSSEHGGGSGRPAAKPSGFASRWPSTPRDMFQPERIALQDALGVQLIGTAASISRGATVHEFSKLSAKPAASPARSRTETKKPRTCAVSSRSSASSCAVKSAR